MVPLRMQGSVSSLSLFQDYRVRLRTISRNVRVGYIFEVAEAIKADPGGVVDWEIVL